MATGDLVVGMVFLSQTILGILGNFSLLCHYLLFHFTGCRARCTDLILRHLTIANSLVIITKGVPQTMAAFGLKYYSQDFRCILLFFVQRVARGVSMESTCLLSVFQAITISPQNSMWAVLKGKAPRYIFPSTIVCWILNILINTIFPLSVIGKWMDANITRKTDYGYCSSVFYHKLIASLFAAWLSFSDVLALGVMLWASGSMVSILYRHKQRVRHIHTTSHSTRSSVESRATQSILVLVSTFVFFYALSSICQICLSFLNTSSRMVVNMSAFFTMCFPFLSPFVLMSYDSRVTRLSFAWRTKENSNILGHLGGSV
ncbi:unnamed protein product [Nyctereutes procyonoides]|uniref:Vomeronasal type-1 receptor n=1 Tax=Nyctereutes procyonoides TaxID=34880 RepID=A0A811ZSS5_NYCPR|nr:vomeronasal type-1 receptor 4-like [Nyctereutes procyonoides]CAD7692207.1 unnamed protein product [Nyctereutes procyonoides]